MRGNSSVVSGRKRRKTPTQAFDLIIVGGGMVGAALACALGGSSLRIGLVDANQPPVLALPEHNDFDPRVSALTMASRNFLENIGAWSFISTSRHSPFERMQVWDADGTGEIVFCAAELGQIELGYIVENSVTLAGIYQRIAQLQNIEIIAPRLIANITELRDGNRSVTLQDGTVLGASLIVGADGAQSKVRELAAIEVEEKDYRQRAMVTTVKTELPHQATAWQRFLPSGPLAFLPLRTSEHDDHYCSIVWSLDEAQAEPLLALDDAAFAAELAQAFEHRLGAIQSVAPRHVFPLRQRHAKTYIKAGLALIGDAAHSIHPLAGQGVNLGLLDAAVLAEEIVRALQRGLPLTEPSLLSRYQRRRVANNMLMMQAMTGFKQLFGNRNPALRWLRNSGMSLVNKLGPVKNHLAAQAMGLSGDLPALARYQPNCTTKSRQ
ncbi:MAG: UbiH/UbiF/VisC/COQ6 family ubiquinone biosynthesis hydroxylase [Pseudomonadales bacterium]|nr:UbiH/UbiF/VisC/COQ6 family ubiquinone biosynthesis hydroxylase [Pseudomonadales bacterium]